MTSEQYQIRPPVAADRAGWELLWQGYLQFYESSLAATTTDTLWQRLIDPGHEIQGRVAVAADATLVGLVHFFPHAHTWHTSPVCYLNDLFVATDIRGRGIGHQLIAAVVALARQQNWDEVYWHTQRHNRSARALYDKVTGGADGFIIYSLDITADSL